MEEKFLELVAEVMEADEKELNMDITYEEYALWDSLMMLNLVMEIEQEYNVLIPMEKIGTIKTLGDLYEFTKE